VVAAANEVVHHRGERVQDQLRRCEVYGVYLWLIVYGKWYMLHVYGQWCMVKGVWYMVYSLWCTVHGSWCMVHDAWCMVPDEVVHHRGQRVQDQLRRCRFSNRGSVAERELDRLMGRSRVSGFGCHVWNLCY